MTEDRFEPAAHEGTIVHPDETVPGDAHHRSGIPGPGDHDDLPRKRPACDEGSDREDAENRESEQERRIQKWQSDSHRSLTSPTLPGPAHNRARGAAQPRQMDRR